MVHTKKVSYSYQKQIAMALKLYYREMFGKNINLEFLFPSRKPQKLPVAIAKEDVLKIIEKANTIKHKSMIALTYSAGVRVGELIGLKSGIWTPPEWPYTSNREREIGIG